MSTIIPLTYRVDYEIGLKHKDLTPVQVQEITLTQRTQRFFAKGRKVQPLCALCEEPLRPLRFNFVALRSATAPQRRSR